ncbi:MAG TPA: VOC family protein [Candidatus Lokiarchaeia archaeon]|nr:VOC family protein [Candidatus Lokiarchaeia archaeon]
MQIKADHFAFAVSDVDRSIAFFQEVLELPLMFVEEDPEHGEKFAFLALDGGNLEVLSSLEGNQPPAVSSFLNCPHLAIGVSDMSEFVARLDQLGVNYEGPNIIPDKVTWLYFRDPDGNVIEACQWLS